jgi:hypothetical protein
VVPRRTSLQWWALKDHYSSLFGVELESSDIKEIRALRQVLTHRRGELRTEELRKEYSEHTDGLPDLVVPLTEAKVLGILDTLGAEARRIDALVSPRPGAARSSLNL